MPVTLTLKRRGAYTNLDYVEGLVKLDITSSEHIDNVTVKVEGISKTTVYAKKPGNDRSKPKPIVEVHKLLYLSQVVWPSAQIRDQKQSSSGAFTLQAGHYEFPFRLRLPVNNSCRPPPSTLSMQNFHISHSALTTVSHPQSHVKQTLPPSLGGIEDAYIRYFVKVTVNRPSIFTRNLRHITPFVFCPIEPPRPPSTTQLFVRKKHTLSSPPSQSPGLLSGLFRKPPSAQGNAGTIVFEARMPNPAIIVPTEPLPLTLLVKRAEGSRGVVYIRSVGIMLGTTTLIAAQGFRRELGYLLPILNVGNLNITIPEDKQEITILPADLVQHISTSGTTNSSGKGATTVGKTTTPKGIVIPDTMPPSFRTCNIARKYTLVLQLGVTSSKSLAVEMIQLTLDVQIYSGFKPPPELLSSAHAPQPPQPPPAFTSSPGKMDGGGDGTQGGVPMAAGQGIEGGLGIGGELPTYDEAVAEVLQTPAVGNEERRGHFEVEAQHLQGAESWDADEKK